MNYFKKFLEFLDKRVEGFGAQYRLFGFFGLINFPLGYYTLEFLGREESIIARLSATLICIPLIFTNKWPLGVKKYINLYWFLTLLYCLPIFGVYTLLKNQVSTDWLMNLSIGLFLLFLLVDYILLLIIYVLGIFLGYLLFISTGQEVVFAQAFPTNFVYLYVCMVLIGCLFTRNKERLENERFQTIKAIAGAVAHEMRTPLFAVESLTYGLKKYVPVLVEFYHSHKNETEILEPSQIEVVSNAAEDIENINRNAFSFIDMLLMNLKEDFSQDLSTVFSMKQCVENALNSYPFGEDEKDLIEYIVKEDFYVKGNELLIRHVFFNLLKNALYYVKAANKGSVTMIIKKQKDSNKLHFKDTGKGIPSSVLPQIFDKFYSKTKYGTGIGLAFCKMVMENLGGDITCRSVEGEFTEFILIFPVIEES